MAVTLQATRGIRVSAETRRRWVHKVGWVWKRAKLVANADDPHRGVVFEGRIIMLDVLLTPHAIRFDREPCSMAHAHPHS